MARFSNQYVITASVIVLNVIMPSVDMTRFIIQNVIIPSVIVLNVIIKSVTMLLSLCQCLYAKYPYATVKCSYVKCRYSKCRCDKCRGAQCIDKNWQPFSLVTCRERSDFSHSFCTIFSPPPSAPVLELSAGFQPPILGLCAKRSTTALSPVAFIHHRS